MRSRTAVVLVAATLIAGCVLNAPRLLAQVRDISGTWQGTVKNSDGQEMRTVIKITVEGSSLRALWYSIDRSAQPLAGAVTLQGTAVTISVPALAGVYSGRLSNEGSTMNGTWTQGGPALPLNLAHVMPEAAWAIPTPPTLPRRMPADANPVFEVATIKPTAPDSKQFGIIVRGGQLFTSAPR